jgi:hypothetical protein
MVLGQSEATHRALAAVAVVLAATLRSMDQLAVALGDMLKAS